MAGCPCGARPRASGRTGLTGGAGPGHFLSLLSLCFFFFLLRLNLKTTSPALSGVTTEAESAPSQHDPDTAVWPGGAPGLGDAGDLGTGPWYQFL